MSDTDARGPERPAHSVTSPADQPLPSLQPWTVQDERLRDVPLERAVFVAALTEAQARIVRARKTGDDRGLVRLLGYTGDALRVLRHLRLARVVLAEALLLGRRLDDASSEVVTMIRLAEVHRFADRYEPAERLLRGVLRRSASEPVSRYRDFALQHLGKTLLDAGRPDEAITCFEEALRLRRQKGDPALVASTEAALRAAQVSAAGLTVTPRSLFKR